MNQSQRTINQGHESQLVGNKLPSADTVRQPAWVESPKNTASSVPDLATASSSTLSNQPPDVPLHLLSSLRSFKFSRNVSKTPSLPRSRISSLRRRFDSQKSEVTASATLSGEKRRETARVRVEPPERASKSLIPKSVTLPNLGTMGSLRQRSRTYASTHWIKQAAKEARTPEQRRSLDMNESPLKDRIGLFESLCRQEKCSESGGCKSLAGKSRPCNPDTLELSGLKRTLRRISGSRRRSSTEWSTTSSRGLRRSKQSSSSGSTERVLGEAASNAGNSGVPPADNELPHERHSTRHSTRPSRPVKAVSSAIQTTETASSRPSPPVHPGYNIDGESGLLAPGDAPLPLFADFCSTTKRQGSFARRPHQLSLPGWTNGDAEHEGRRNWMTRKSSPLIIEQQCTLRHPRPIRHVHANDLNRLVNLCKEKMRRLSGGKSE